MHAGASGYCPRTTRRPSAAGRDSGNPNGTLWLGLGGDGQAHPNRITGRNPVGIVRIFGRTPKVAPSSQTWAHVERGELWGGIPLGFSVGSTEGMNCVDALALRQGGHS